MAANRDLILAGIAGGGAGSSLAYFGPKGTVLPTAASGAGSTLDAALMDAGWLHADGLNKASNESVTDINAFGSQVPVRSYVSHIKLTFDLKFLESNRVALSLYNRVPLVGAGSLTVTTGKTTVAEGFMKVQEYCGVFDIIDGANRLRIVVPVLQVTTRAAFTVKAGEPIVYGVTCTAYPGSDGVAASYYYEVAGLT